MTGRLARTRRHAVAIPGGALAALCLATGIASAQGSVPTVPLARSLALV